MIAAASPGWSLARAAVRAGLLAAAFVVAFVVWFSLIARDAGTSPGAGAALGTSLGPLLLGLILGTAAGVAVAVAGAAADGLEVDQPGAAGPLKLVLRLVALPWIAMSPFTLATAWVVLLGIAAGSSAALEVVVIGGLVAVIVAGAAYDPLRRSDAPGAALATMGGVGWGLLAGTGALVLVETVAGRPGLGRLLIESVLVYFPSGPLVAVLLVIGLVGSLLSLAGAGPSASGAAAETAAQLWWLRTSVASLGLPVLVLLFSLAVARDGTPRFDVAGALAPPSLLHPLGTDQLGQDLLGQLMIGYRNSLGLALGAALLAAVVGGAWGGLAAVLARAGAIGGTLADVIVAPAWVIAMLPLLPAVVLLRVRAPGLAIAAVIGLGLLARTALAVRDLAPLDLAPATAARAAAGAFLLCLGVAFVAGTGADAIGIGTAPPTASLGRLVGDAIQLPLGNAGGRVAWVAWLSVVTAGPCLFAAWSLLRPFNRGQAWGRLLA